MSHAGLFAGKLAKRIDLLDGFIPLLSLDRRLGRVNRRFKCIAGLRDPRLHRLQGSKRGIDTVDGVHQGLGILEMHEARGRRRERGIVGIEFGLGLACEGGQAGANSFRQLRFRIAGGNHRVRQVHLDASVLQVGVGGRWARPGLFISRQGLLAGIEIKRREHLLRGVGVRGTRILGKIVLPARLGRDSLGQKVFGQFRRRGRR